MIKDDNTQTLPSMDCIPSTQLTNLPFQITIRWSRSQQAQLHQACIAILLQSMYLPLCDSIISEYHHRLLNPEPVASAGNKGLLRDPVWIASGLSWQQRVIMRPSLDCWCPTMDSDSVSFVTSQARCLVSGHRRAVGFQVAIHQTQIQWLCSWYCNTQKPGLQNLSGLGDKAS